MAHHVDFRDYYGSVIDGWLGGGSSEVLNRSIEDLGLFASAPGGTAPNGPTRPPGVSLVAGSNGYRPAVRLRAES